MRVLFIVAGDRHVSGVVRYDQEVINGLRGLGLDVQVFTPGMILDRGDKSQLTDVKYLWSEARNSLALWGRGARDAFRAYLAECCPDVAHLSLETSLIFSPLAHICAELGIPTVGTEHQPIHTGATLAGLISRLSYRLITPFLRDVTRVIVFSEPQKQAMIRAGFPAERLAIIPNGVDVDKFSPGPSQFRDEMDADCVVLYIGRFSYQKNTNLLLDVFDKCQFGERVKLVMVGAGDQFKAAQRKYGDHPNIHLLGVIRDEARVIDIWRGSDIFAQPSRYEGLSISLLEGMSAGAACITSAVGAHPDVVTNAGILLDPQRDVRWQLKLALQTLVGNRELREVLARQARQRVVEGYSLKHMFSTLVALYEDVIAETEGARVGEIEVASG